jgi:hypothetical protein
VICKLCVDLAEDGSWRAWVLRVEWRMVWRVCQYLIASKAGKAVLSQAVTDEELDVLTNSRLED